MLTKEQIIKLCKDAGVFSAMYGEEPICKLIDAAMKLEREECARVCEQTNKYYENPDYWDWHSKDYAKAIRQRNEL